MQGVILSTDSPWAMQQEAAAFEGLIFLLEGACSAGPEQDEAVRAWVEQTVLPGPADAQVPVEGTYRVR